MAENKAVVENKKNEVSYTANGEEVKLSPFIVRNLLNQNTKNLTDAEVFKFIQLCRFRKLNPFLNEAYLVKYGNEPAQMIVGFEAMRKNALSNEKYLTHSAGVIVLRDNKIVEEVGAFKLPKDVLVGGWAKVFLKDLDQPIEMKVSFDEYNKGQSTWKKMPCVMIRKVALSQAFREAFPEECGSMYTNEEMQPIGEDKPYKGKTREEFIQDRLKEVKTKSNPVEEDIPFTDIQEAEVIQEEQIDF